MNYSSELMIELKLSNLTTVREKLELLVDNEIQYDSIVSQSLRDIVEDLQDQVHDDVENNSRSIEAEISNLSVQGGVDIPEVLPRKSIAKIPSWTINEAGQVFNSRGQLARKIFNPQLGGWLVRAKSDGSYYQVGHLVLTAFGNCEPATRILYRDQNMSNCHIDNLRYLYGTEDNSI